MSYVDLAGLVTFRPLAIDVKRPRSARRSLFSASWSSTVDLLVDELRHLGAKRVVLEIDIREQDLRLDGLPRASAVAASPVVVLSMETRYGYRRFQVDAFDRWQDNVRAIALGLQALRAVDRYGITRRGEQYDGWKALPAPSDGGASVQRGRELVERFGGLRGALRATHPDTRDMVVGGEGTTDVDFRSVQMAREAGVA